MTEGFERNEEDRREEISNRVTQHSQEFDRITREKQQERLSRIENAREVSHGTYVEQEWVVGDCEVMAIGVSHIPETFLEFRQRIEQAIENSDIVVTEVTPEADGWYSKAVHEELHNTPCQFNRAISLEDVRRDITPYVEKADGFFHEVELLTAKYGKDLASVDLVSSRDIRDALQSADFYSIVAHDAEDKKAALKRLMVLGIGVAGATAGAHMVRKSIEQQNGAEGQPAVGKLNRRTFLGAAAVAGSIAAGVGGTELVRNKTGEEFMDEFSQQEGNLETYFEEMYLQELPARDAYAAESIAHVAELGYKKITVIYGAGHMKGIKKFLDNPKLRAKTLEQYGSIIEKRSPDSCKIYKLDEGRNDSEEFVASEDMIWYRAN
jgi:hypothetical protein